MKSKKEPTDLLETINPGSFYWKQSDKFGIWGNCPCWEEQRVKIFSIQLEDLRHWQAFIPLERLLRKTPTLGHVI